MVEAINRPTKLFGSAPNETKKKGKKEKKKRVIFSIYTPLIPTRVFVELILSCTGVLGAEVTLVPLARILIRVLKIKTEFRLKFGGFEILLAPLYSTVNKLKKFQSNVNVLNI